MKHVAISVLALAVCAVWTPASAQDAARDYIYIDDDGEIISFLDKSSFARVDAATMSGLSIDLYREAAVVDDTKRDDTLIYAKCTESQFGIKSLRSFDRAGKQNFEMIFEDDEVQYIPAGPDTVGARMIGLICGTQTAGEDDVVPAMDVADLQEIFDAVVADEDAQ